MSILGVVLEPREPVLLHVEESDGPLVIEGQAFTPVIPGDFTGFYDWLRPVQPDADTVVGVRYHLLESGGEDQEWDALATAVGRTSYGLVDATRRTVEVTWPMRQAHDPKRSSDQCFGGNRYLRSSSGLILLTFSLYGLTPSEQESALRACRAQ